MRRMDFGRPHATLMPPQGRAVYRQGSILFDAQGNEVGTAEGGEEAAEAEPAADADTDTVDDALAAENAALKAQLAEVQRQMAALKSAPAPTPPNPTPPTTTKPAATTAKPKAST